MMDFRGKSVIITGAGKGVGRETAKRFALEGASVGLVSRTEADLTSLQAEISDFGGKALPLVCDVSVEQDVVGAVARMKAAFGRVDVLVNNAAVFRGGMVDEMSLADWKLTTSVILDGTFLCCKHVLPLMKANNFGRIVNISSSAISYPFKTYSAYAAAKAGVVAFGKTLTEEVRDYDIAVNTIILGLTNTDEVKKRATIPPEKMLQPFEVAQTIMYLSSKASNGFKGSAVEFFGDYK